MRRCTLNFSMYSDMSMRTIERSSESKSVLGQRLGELGLAHAGGAQEQESCQWAGPGRQGPLRLRLMAPATDAHRLVLADDAALQRVLQVDELGHLALHHLGRRGRPSRLLTTSAISSAVTSSLRTAPSCFLRRLEHAHRPRASC